MVSPMPKPRRRAASCCRVAVVKGGSGWRLSVSRSIDETAKVPARIRSTASLAILSDASPASSIPSPSSLHSVAGNGAPSCAANSASTVQYAFGAKASISASRSQTSRSATDCTRPAERQPGSLRHRTGDRP